MTTNFKESSYEAHKMHYENVENSISALWENKSSVDYWRHERMYNCIDPIIESYQEAKWLTLGDGRYGTDANYIISKGSRNVIASDIADTYLKVAKEKGFINDYAIENAEQISYKDGSFDFVLCKESYHHFPRPMIALYEMLRVASKGIVLIEPRDHNILTADYNKGISFYPLLKEVKTFIKKLLGRKPYYEFGNYETVGNYVYTISEREIEKVALGLNFPMVAFKGLDDYYIEGGEKTKKTDKEPLFQQLNNLIRKADQRVNRGEAMPGLLVAIVFKRMPNDDCIKALVRAGFNIKTLSRNPYITL